MIEILNIQLNEEDFPKLYRIAQNNPEGLERTLKSLAVASGGKPDDYTSVAINLENDLQHG